MFLYCLLTWMKNPVYESIIIKDSDYVLLTQHLLHKAFSNVDIDHYVTKWTVIM